MDAKRKWICESYYSCLTHDTFNGCDITVTLQGETYNGNIDGDTIQWQGSFDENGGTTTTRVSLTIDGTTLSGSSDCRHVSYLPFPMNDDLASSATSPSSDRHAGRFRRDGHFFHSSFACLVRDRWQTITHHEKHRFAYPLTSTKTRWCVCSWG